MRLGLAILLGILGGVGVAWWLARDTPARSEEKQVRAERAAAADFEDARPVLYRWRDDAGALHVTEAAPKGRQYERIPMQPDAGIEVHGDRE
jgi:hypothetical protein